jgi:hypothetical protein
MQWPSATDIGLASFPPSAAINLYPPDAYQSLAGQRQMGSAKRTDMVNDRAIVTFACLPTLVDKHMQYA